MLTELTVILFVWSAGGSKLCSLLLSVNLTLLGRLETQRKGGREPTSKGELLSVVMAAGKCTLGWCVSKVKRDAGARLVSFRQTNWLTCSNWLRYPNSEQH